MMDHAAYEIRSPAADVIRLERLGRRRYLLQIVGYLPDGWQAHLASALAQAALNIVEGFTACDGFAKWRGEVEFDRAPASRDPELLDFAALVRQASNPVPLGRTRIEAFEVARVAHYGGSLRLAVRGHDEVGFLAALLSACASADLHPLELRIRTRQGKVDDLAYLKHSCLKTPTHESEAIVREWLTRHTVA
jgi:hypothetical protein